MTQPRQARSGGSGPRIYSWPPTPPHEFEVVSVTSAIGSLPKPWLLPWAVKMTAECAVDNVDLLKTMVEADPRAAVDYLKGARYRDSGAKADRGTIVHGAVEAYLAGTRPTKSQVDELLAEKRVDKKLWASTHKMLTGVIDFLVESEIEVFHSEATVYSRTHGYAGTPDIIGAMRIGGTIQPVVVDIKTSKRIYDETALQTCAYGRADFVGLDDGTEVDLISGVEDIDYGVVVRPKPTGGFETATFVHTDEVYDLFLALLAVTKNQGALEGSRRP